MAGIQAVLGFDMETDVGSFTPFYEGLARGTPIILEVLARHGISATFFFTGDAARQHPEVAIRVKDAGHEIGAHSLYHETVGDPLFDIPGLYPLLPEEVPNRLRRATEWVQEATGVRPVSFRAPRLFGSTAVVNALEDLGYVADATYPMYFYRERLRPYHPNRTDWTQVGDMRIAELPNFADLSMESHDQYGRDMDQWPLFRTESAEAVLRHIDGYIAYCRQRDVEPFLCFYLHPWEFHPMPEGPIHFGEASVIPDPFIVKNCGPYAVEQLDALVSALLARGTEFMQARQAAALA
ncbi:MAG: polysaccharide deacetylase family protein [Anaerolineae bacterium]|nr:polysaccharide deacetylase family protein [Anaerolineae bacterium]